MSVLTSEELVSELNELYSFARVERQKFLQHYINSVVEEVVPKLRSRAQKGFCDAAVYIPKTKVALLDENSISAKDITDELKNQPSLKGFRVDITSWLDHTFLISVSWTPR